LQITGCLAPLNTSYIQEGIKKNMKAVIDQGWTVDIFGAVKACNVEEEALMPRIANVFKSFCSDCAIKVDAIPTDYHLWAKDKAGMWSLPHLHEYEKRWDLTGPAFFEREVVSMLRSRTDMYSVTWTFTTDMRLDGLKWKQMLLSMKRDQMLWFVPSKPFIHGYLPDIPSFTTPTAGAIHDKIFADLERFFEDGELTLDDDEATLLDHNMWHENAGVGLSQCHAMPNVTTTKCVNATNGICQSIINFDSYPEAHVAKCPIWNASEGCQSHAAGYDIYNRSVTCDEMLSDR